VNKKIVVILGQKRDKDLKKSLKKTFFCQMWGQEEETQEPIVEPEIPTTSRSIYMLYFLAIVFLVYFFYLFTQECLYEHARLRLLRTQANTLTGNLPEAAQNFYAAVQHWEKLVRE
jgi:hypothetical protein